MKPMRIGASAACVSLALALGACGSGSSGGSGGAGGQSGSGGGGSVKVGAIFPLSGTNGSIGQEIVSAMKVEAGIINRQGGVNGKKIQIAAADDKATPAVGVSAANDLISQGVTAIIEGYDSPVSLAEQPVINRAGVTHIVAISKAAELLNDKYTVRMNSSSEQDAGVMAGFMLNKLKAKRIAYVYENDAYGQGVLQQMKQQIGSQAQDVAEVGVSFDQTDFRVAVTKVKGANPDVVLFVDAAETTGEPAFISEYRRQNVDADLFVATGNLAPIVINAIGKPVNGAYSADNYFPDVKPFTTYQANAKFVQAFKRANKGDMPNKFDALAAAAVEIWADASNKAGSTDRDKVVPNLRGQSFQDTVFGALQILPSGQSKIPQYVIQIKNQKIDILSRAG